MKLLIARCNTIKHTQVEPPKKHRGQVVISDSVNYLQCSLILGSKNSSEIVHLQSFDEARSFCQLSSRRSHGGTEEKEETEEREEI